MVRLPLIGFTAVFRSYGARPSRENSLLPVCDVWLLPFFASVWPEVPLEERHGWNSSASSVEEASNPPSAQAEACLSGPLEGPGAGTTHCGSWPRVARVLPSGLRRDRSVPTAPFEAWSFVASACCGKPQTRGLSKEAGPGVGREAASRSSTVPGCESVSAHVQVSYARL